MADSVEKLRARIKRNELTFDQTRLPGIEVADVSFEGVLNEKNPKMLMMRGSDFSGAKLVRWKVFLGAFFGSNFQRAHFRDCQFRSCQFQGSDFFGATFVNCTFVNCYMFEAFYSLAVFEKCVFMQTSMRDSVMSRVSFFGTNLDGILFDGVEDATSKAMEALPDAARNMFSDTGGAQNIVDDASLEETIRVLAMNRAALQGNVGKKHADGEHFSERHAKNSSSLAAIEKFLRTTTLTSTEISDFLKRAGAKSRARSFFISYSFKDSELAEKLAARLGARGTRVWFAPANMRAGSTISQQLHEGVFEADVMLVLVSRNSIASDWVSREIVTFHGVQKEHPDRTLCPLRVDEAWDKGFDFVGASSEIGHWFRSHYAPNFADWRDSSAFSTAFEQLARDFDVVPKSLLSDVAKDLNKDSLRTIERITDTAGIDLPPKLRARADAAAAGKPDIVGIGTELVSDWIQARNQLQRERSARNLEAEASRARRLASFLDNNRHEQAGMLVTALAAQEIQSRPDLAIQPVLAKAMLFYVEKAQGVTRGAKPSGYSKPKRSGWWPFGGKR